MSMGVAKSLTRSAVWHSEVVPLLESDGALNGVTLLEELQRGQRTERPGNGSPRSGDQKCD